MFATLALSEEALPLRDDVASLDPSSHPKPSTSGLPESSKSAVAGALALDPLSPDSRRQSPKLALQALLRAKKLEREAPPLRGDDLRPRRLSCGLPEIDRALAGGLPRGAVSECFGPASSGRTGTALAFAAHATREGALVAWVDPGDHLDPASAAEAGVDLDRLLWLRGGGSGGGRTAPPGRPLPGLPEALTALGVLTGSALFDLIVLDLAGVPVSVVQRLPAAAWVKLGRAVEPTASAVLILGREHMAKSAPGVALALLAATPRFGGSGPGRLFRGLDVRGPGLPPFHLAAAFD